MVAECQCTVRAHGPPQETCGRRPDTFKCPRCTRLLPGYFRAVWYYNPCPRDVCYECMLEATLGGTRTRERRTPTVCEVVEDVQSGYSQVEIAALWGVTPRTIRRVLSRAAAE